MIKKKSPYQKFRDWLHHPSNIQLDPEVIKGINKRSILCMFGNSNKLTIFLNKHFNNFGMMKLDDEEFYLFIKQLVKDFRLDKYSYSFFHHSKIDKELRELHKKFPYLKRTEITALLEFAKEDEEFNRLEATLGIEKVKKTKSRKKKSESAKSGESFSDWLNNFGKREGHDGEIAFQKAN